jgi:hypothetical protein
MNKVPNAAAKSANGTPTPIPTPIAVFDPSPDVAHVGEFEGPVLVPELVPEPVDPAVVDEVVEVVEADPEAKALPAIPLTFPFGMSNS